jgi:hypothetical protein
MMLLRADTDDYGSSSGIGERSNIFSQLVFLIFLIEIVRRTLKFQAICFNTTEEVIECMLLQ